MKNIVEVELESEPQTQEMHFDSPVKRVKVFGKTNYAVHLAWLLILIISHLFYKYHNTPDRLGGELMWISLPSEHHGGIVAGDKRRVQSLDSIGFHAISASGYRSHFRKAGEGIRWMHLPKPQKAQKTK